MMMMENTFPSGGGDDDDVHRLVLLPVDVLIEILVWLPIVSLLRFKSVCKSWLALIATSFFIHLHTVTSSSNSSKFGDFIFDALNRKEARIFMLKSKSGNGGVEVVEDFRFPPFYMITTTVPVEKTKLSIAGSCNGLICLLDSLYSRGRDVSLWNPATRQFRLLPKSLTLKEEEEEEEIKIYRHIYDVFGFGFDVKTKDYKVVKISTFFHRKVEGMIIVLRVQVYSLNSNSWRVLDGGDGGINSLFPKPVQELYIQDGVYLNGSYFLNGNHKTEDGFDQLVLSFDFTKEIFTAIQFPANHHDFNSPLFLACYYFGEKQIATLSRRGGDDDDDQSNLLVYDIWVLNIIERHDQEEEEEEESYYWTKLQHSIQIRKPKQMIGEPIIPRFISNDGEFALIETRGDDVDDCKLQLFNLVTKEEKTVFPTGFGLLRAYVYKPSLVSIVGGGGNGNGTAAAAAAAADWGVLW